MVPYLVVVVDDGSSVGLGNPSDPVLVGAGDIANCGGTDPFSSGAEQTALLLDVIESNLLDDDMESTVFIVGDGAYTDGTFRQRGRSSWMVSHGIWISMPE